MAWRSLLDGFRRDDLDALNRRALHGFASVNWRIAKLHQYIVALDQMTESRVLTVETRLVGEANEKLATRGVRFPGSSHGDDAARVVAIAELRLQIVIGVSRSPQIFLAGILGERIAALNHEALDNSMKARAIVKTILRELDKTRHRLRGDFRPEFDNHIALAGFNNGHLLRSGLSFGRAQCGDGENGGDKCDGEGN